MALVRVDALEPAQKDVLAAVQSHVEALVGKVVRALVRVHVAILVMAAAQVPQQLNLTHYPIKSIQ